MWSTVFPYVRGEIALTDDRRLYDFDKVKFLIYFISYLYKVFFVFIYETLWMTLVTHHFTKLFILCQTSYSLCLDSAFLQEE